MKLYLCTALAVVSLLPALAGGQQPAAEVDADVDEVVVVGRSVSTGLAKIEVDRQMLVDTATALKDIPGANVNGNGPVTGIAQYRGMYGDRIAVVIDHLGIVSGGPNAMDAPLSYVSPMIAGDLVVMRGIPGVAMSPESIGGQVSTTLARGEFATVGSELSGFVGSRYAANGNVNTTAGRMTFANPAHKLSLVAEIDDGDDLKTPVGVVRPSRLHRERADVSYAHAGERGTIMVFAGQLDTDDTGTPALPMDIRYIRTDLAGAQVFFEVSDALSIDGRVAWNDVEHLMDNFGLRLAPMAPMQRQNLTAGRGIQLRLAANLALASSTLSVGLDASSADHEATISNPNNAMFRIANFVDVGRDVASAFVEWRREGVIGDVELGLRARRVEADAGQVAASGLMGDMGTSVALLAEAFNSADRGLSWDSADAVVKLRRRDDAGTDWHVELGSKSRAPSYQELYLWLPLQATGGLADGRSYIGGLGLDVERSNEIAAGFARRVGRLTVSPEAFYRRVDGYIQGVPSTSKLANRVSQMMSGMPALQFVNVDAEIWGIDLAWNVALGDHWYADGIASWSRGKRRDAHDNLYRLAAPNASAGLNWEFDRLSMTTELVAYAKQDKVSGYNAEQTTPGYALANAMLVWSPRDTLRFEARVDNLFDRSYQDHTAGINRARGSDIAVGERLYGAERGVSVGVFWTF